MPPPMLPPPADGLRLSAKTGDGLQALRGRLLEIAGWQAAPEGVYIARERHLQALRRVDAHLTEAGALPGRRRRRRWTCWRRSCGWRRTR